MEPFHILSRWVGASVGLILLGEITGRARKRLEELKAQGAGQPAEPTGPPAQPVAEKDSPKRSTPAWMVAMGVLAFLLAPLWGPVVWLNSYVIALSLSAFLPQGEPLFTLTVGSWMRDIYINDLIAAVVCLFQAVGGATWVRCAMTLADEELPLKQRPVILKFLRFAMALTILSLAFEVGTAVYRGLKLMDLYNAIGSGLGALLPGLGEVVLGTLVIDFLLLPIALALWQWWRSRRKNLLEPLPPRGLRLPWLLHFLAFLDETIMKWLRALDNWSWGLISRRFRGRVQDS